MRFVRVEWGIKYNDGIRPSALLRPVVEEELEAEPSWIAPSRRRVYHGASSSSTGADPYSSSGTLEIRVSALEH
ncbi:unnamed protein product [Linum trigynum]|uniref:Uncharacterized protein n=1 Tax=Linum trigynum TaxID=586398 RepID=A0AAV2CYA1_9ROSI